MMEEAKAKGITYHDLLAAYYDGHASASIELSTEIPQDIDYNSLGRLFSLPWFR
jgi:hypothetical protein